MLNIKLFVIPHWFPIVWAIAMTLIVVWRGGWRERVITASQVSQLLSVRVLVWLGIYDGATPVWRLLASDTGLLVICLVCAWRTERYPLLWASSCALLTVAANIMGLFVPGVTFWAYASASIIWSYLLSACVMWSALSDPPQGWRQAAAKARPVRTSTIGDVPRRSR